jgi:hypothetical protein
LRFLCSRTPAQVGRGPEVLGWSLESSELHRISHAADWASFNSVCS